MTLPTKGCYLVSNSTSSVLRIAHTTSVTIEGNGSTFLQRVYANWSCQANVVQPILSLLTNTSLTIENLTLDGPMYCSGSRSEGDYGIYYAAGNRSLLFNGVTVENVDGDGIASFPGVNFDTTFENGKLYDIGYHGLSLQGDDGFTFAHNTVQLVGNFIDLENDADCSAGTTGSTGAGQSCWNADGTPAWSPTNQVSAQWDITISDNNFIQGIGGVWIASEQAACVPQGNLTVIGNQLDSTVAPSIVLLGSNVQRARYPQHCPATDSGLTIENNYSAAAATPGGSIASPPAPALLQIMDYSNVTVTGNNFLMYAGSTTYYPNTPYIPAVALCGVSGATVADNTFNNAWAPSVASGCFDAPSSLPADSAITTCGNAYWLTQPVNGVAADVRHDGVCAP